MMRSSLPRRVALSLFAAALLGLGASSASAQSPDRDFVTGESGGEFVGHPAFRFILVFDASSGPSGENPTGTVRIDSETFGLRQTLFIYNVTCLSVAGHQATIGGVAVIKPPSLPAYALFYVEDGVGGAPDRAGGSFDAAPPTCPAPPFDETKTDASVTGELTVHDALAVPTEPRQCKNGGWSSFPQFKSQGQCIAFINHGS
jgi:hypothetical protein